MMKYSGDKKSADGRKRNRWRAVAVWMWLAVAGMVVFEAWVANSQATNGQKLAELQDKQSQLTAEVSRLERQVATAGSLQLVQQRATDQLGLQPIVDNVLYMTLHPVEDSDD